MEAYLARSMRSQPRGLCGDSASVTFVTLFAEPTYPFGRRQGGPRRYNSYRREEFGVPVFGFKFFAPPTLRGSGEQMID